MITTHVDIASFSELMETKTEIKFGCSAGFCRLDNIQLDLSTDPFEQPIYIFISCFVVSIRKKVSFGVTLYYSHPFIYAVGIGFYNLHVYCSTFVELTLAQNFSYLLFAYGKKESAKYIYFIIVGKLYDVLCIWKFNVFHMLSRKHLHVNVLWIYAEHHFWWFKEN